MSKNNTNNKISIKFLIHLVGERPALWDKTSEAYKDRGLKETSWREICTFITENYDHMQPKTKDEFTKMITKKWTHIRDSWVKSMKYGYDEITKLPPKPYVYHDDLKFMQKILKCKPRRYDFSIPKMEISNYETFYGEKDGTQNSIPYEGNDEDEDNEQHEENHEHDENVKQELQTQGHIIENHTVEEDDDEDWPLDEAHTPIIEIKREPNHVMSKCELKSEQQKQNRVQVKKRMSIFKNARGEDDDESPRASMSFSSNNYLNENRNKYLTDNRHWNFFKGILPSVNVLDEDQTLQFQACIISLLQKLRNQTTKSAKTSKSSARKRKPSDDDDYEWPIQVNTSKRYSTRNARDISDPIGGEELEFESEQHSSDNE